MINDDTANFLVVANARPANIYFLPKIHKPQRPPPARPICNTINSPTANISKWVDDQFQPLVKKLPSHLKDDNDFLRKLVEINNTETLPPETLLVSWDVKSLYTNIPHASGMGACEYYMRAHGFNENKISTILRFINLVLTCNNLTFQGNHFVQQTGTAMGTKMAPTYANLFMGHLEEQLLDQTMLKPLIWFRFIDDIFFLWTFGRIKLNQFYEQCNNFDPHIKFEQSVSSSDIPFLDVNVILQDGKIITDLYTKPTDTHQYLNWTSCHPRHTKTAIPYSLALRLRRICSTEDFFKKRTDQLHNILLDRGYKEKLIKDSISKARQVSREQALRTDIEKKGNDRVPLVVTYNPALADLRRIIKVHQPILHTSQRCTDVFSQPPIIAYRKGRNLTQILTSKRLTPLNSAESELANNRLSQLPINTPNPTETECVICHRTFNSNKNLKIHFTHRHKQRPVDSNTQPGFWPCNNDSRCACCKTYGFFTQNIVSTTTGERVSIRENTTCQTSNVVYLVTCEKCKEQYVGETGNCIRLRANQHRSDIQTGHKNIPTVRHFRACGLKYFKLTELEGVRNSDVAIRRARESFWINKLKPVINN